MKPLALVYSIIHMTWLSPTSTVLIFIAVLVETVQEPPCAHTVCSRAPQV